MVKIYIDPEILALRELHSDLLARDYLSLNIRDRLASQARTIFEGHKRGNHAVAFHLGSWCQGFIGADSEQIMASSLSLDQAQQTIAMEHGYADWSEVEALSDTLMNQEFEKTVDVVLHGDIDQLQDRLDANSELVDQRSQYGHRATLLHYLGANGVESYRQITPLNAPDVAQCLIRAGADVNANAEMYGGGSSALALVLSSAHPHNAGVAIAIAEVLKGAGAV